MENFERNNAIFKILKGVGISFAFTLICLTIFSGLLTYTNLGENTIGPVIIGITGISILARKLNDYKCNQKEWNIKWRNNRSCIHTFYLSCIKRDSEVDLV